VATGFGVQTSGQLRVCVHAICRELGFPGGFLTDGAWSANCEWKHVLETDGVVIGVCFPGQALDSCTGGENLHTVGGTPACQVFNEDVPEEVVLTT
jgi:hypothetical protein